MKHFLALIMAMMLTLSVLSGCTQTAVPSVETADSSVQTQAPAQPSSDETDASDTAQPEPVTLDPVDLTMYFVSEAPRDLDMVLELVNNKLRADLNTTVSIKFSTWTDYQQKYDLALMSGDNIDVIYTAPWMNYPQYANQGAFLELEEMLPQYAPLLWEQIEESVWSQVSVKGHIYAVPSLNYVYGSKGVLYRADLAEAYDLPVPDSVENVERFLLGVKENDPSHGLFRVYVEGDGSSEMFAAHGMIMAFKRPLVFETNSNYGLIAEYTNPSELIDYWGSDDLIEDLKILRRWSELGFWSKSIMSETPDVDSFNTGKTALSASGLNPGKASGARQQLKAINPEWRPEYIMFSEIHGYAYRATPMADMCSIPFASKNPERALMVIERFMTDEDYYMLVQYGIEGEHYNFEDGVFVPVLDADGSGGYEQGAYAWCLENRGFSVPMKDGEYFEGLYATLEKLRSNTPFGAADIAGGFMEDIDAYQSERAALASVVTQYLAPLEAGMIEDIEAGVETFRQKAKEAGLEKIQEEFRKQWTAYCEEYDYK